jgi:hypothetical protein
MHLVHATVARSSITSIPTYLDLNASWLLPLSLRYAPSVYSIPSWRNSTITLFEEDTQLVRLGIWRDVKADVGSSRACVHTARASKVVQEELNKPTAGLLDTVHS